MQPAAFFHVNVTGCYTVTKIEPIHRKAEGCLSPKSIVLNEAVTLMPSPDGGLGPAGLQNPTMVRKIFS